MNKVLLIMLLLLNTIQLSSQSQVFDAVDWNSNSTPRNNWLAAIGETPDIFIDFEDSNLRNSPPGPAYKNLHNVNSLFPLGLILIDEDASLWVSEGASFTWEDVDNNGQEDLGRASSYNATVDPANNNWSLSSFQENDLTLDFTANPVDYVCIYWTDWDLRGEAENFIDNANVLVTYIDNTTEQFATDRTSSGNSSSNAGWEFWGIFNNTKPAIKSIRIEPSDHDSEWGIDNIEYGTISSSCPDPPSTTLVCSDNSDSVTLTADSGYTNYMWYVYNTTTMSKEGLALSASQTLQLQGSDVGSIGTTVCYIYEATDGNGCPIELCCPECVQVEDCGTPCPLPNCTTVTYQRNN